MLVDGADIGEAETSTDARRIDVVALTHIVYKVRKKTEEG